MIIKYIWAASKNNNYSSNYEVPFGPASSHLPCNCDAHTCKCLEVTRLCTQSEDNRPMGNHLHYPRGLSKLGQVRN